MSVVFSLYPFFKRDSFIIDLSFLSYPLKVEQVFFEGLSGLGLLALIHYVWVLFVATALVVLTAMSLPITQTHPAEIYTQP